jgi:transposase
MSKSNKSYTSEFKENAIKLALNSVSVSHAAKELGVPEATMHAWVSKAKKAGNVSVSSEDGIVNHVNVGQVIDENRELKKRIARLEQEKAILKKAATYFASELQ